MKRIASISLVAFAFLVLVSQESISKRGALAPASSSLEDPTPPTIVHHFPTITVNDIDDLPSKILIIRQTRENWLSIVKSALGGGPVLDSLIDALRYQFENNLANAINDMIANGLPVMIDVGNLTVSGSASSSASSSQEGNGELMGPVMVEPEGEGEEEEEMDCFPADAFGPPPPGMDWCPPNDPPPEEPLDQFCLDYPSYCSGLDDLTGGTCGGYGLGSDFEYGLFPPSATINLGGPWRLSGELYIGDPPGGLFEDHTRGIKGGFLITLSLSF